MEWLGACGFFDKPLVGDYITRFTKALRGSGELPRLTAMFPDATVAEGFAVQKRLVREQLTAEMLAGYKGGATNVAAQQQMGINHPMSATTPTSGWRRNSHMRLATATDVAIVDEKINRKTPIPRR